MYGACATEKDTCPVLKQFTLYGYHVTTWVTVLTQWTLLKDNSFFSTGHIPSAYISKLKRNRWKRYWTLCLSVYSVMELFPDIFFYFQWILSWCNFFTWDVSIFRMYVRMNDSLESDVRKKWLKRDGKAGNSYGRR